MEEIDLKELLTILWKKKILIIIITILGLGIGLVYNIFFTIPKYKSTVNFLLTQSADSAGNVNIITSTDLSLNSKLLNNYTELIKSDIILAEVINSLGLTIDISDLQKDISIENEKNTEFIELTVKSTDKEQAVLIANKIIELFNEKIKEIYNMENVYVLNEAIPSNKPYNINPPKYALIGAVIGFVISLCIIFLKNMLDDTIKSETAVEQSLGIKTLAKFRKQPKNTKLEWNPKYDHIEGIKALRTNLQFVKREKNVKTIAITSSMPGEGKSWIASNLALAYAKADYKVCMVDADMRKGTQHIRYNVKQTPGFSDLIISNDDINDFKLIYNKYIKPTRFENIFILPCGNYTFESSELLISNKLNKMVTILKENFDIIIFDSTPSTLVTDATILARLVETNIVVVEYEKTKMKDLRRIKELIEGVGGDLAGIVINKINDDKKKKYYYYYDNNKKSKSKNKEKSSRH